jgi:hypothetical protein
VCHFYTSRSENPVLFRHLRISFLAQRVLIGKQLKNGRLYKSQKILTKETPMKRTLLALAIIGLCILFAETTFAQATQQVNLTVGSVSKIAVGAASVSMTISDGVAGTDALTPATGNSTYSITHNSTSSLRITASIDQPLPAGLSLSIALTPGSGKGTSSGTIDISNATTAVEVVNTIPRGADANAGITYTFGATASAGEQTLQRDVTLTLTN